MIFESLLPPLAAIVLPSILLLTGCRSANSYLNKGNAAFARGQFEEASLDYRKAVQKDAGFGEAYFREGLTELKQNKAAEALQDLEQAVRLMPANREAKTELTNLMLGAYIGDPKRPKFLYDLLVKYSGEWLTKDPNSLQGLRIHGISRHVRAAAGRSRQRVPPGSPTRIRATRRSSMASWTRLFRANQPAEAEKVGLDYLRTNSSASDVYDALFRMYEGAPPHGGRREHS